MRLWPRSIRWQMLASLLLLEALSLLAFFFLLTRRQSDEVYERARHRLAHQASSVALQVRTALLQNRLESAQLSVDMMGESPSVSLAKFTDTTGKVLVAGGTRKAQADLNALELSQIGKMRNDESRVFDLGGNHWEGVRPVYVNGVLRGYVWVETDRAWDDEELNTVRMSTMLFALIWMIASAALVGLLARSIAMPLADLHRGTRALMVSPERCDIFPLPVKVRNEFGDLIEAFNRMVASIEEHRSGLNDTLSMLDSMLANAPVGLAFFDRQRRMVRVNHVFAEMTGVSISRHLGRTLTELLPVAAAQEIEDAVSQVFTAGEPVPVRELSGEGGALNRPWTWLVSAYPVRAGTGQVRWAGVTVVDTSERKRSEEALRRTEKLAATGRLAASIAHEINNPLEAITNLLFLLHNYSGLDGAALNYVEMAEHEARRIAEITQQTLRFYRQSTLPARAKLAEILDSVLSLYRIRLRNLGIKVESGYDPDIDLFCFAGEIRQVIANLVGNAIDASPSGGRLIIRGRRSCDWRDYRQAGVRFTVADTGLGFNKDVGAHIFEAFFTTKPVTGTGLGLWVSHEIILKHHGIVHVKSRTRENGSASGTVFQIFFPDNQDLVTPGQQLLAAESEATDGIAASS